MGSKVPAAKGLCDRSHKSQDIVVKPTSIGAYNHPIYFNGEKGPGTYHLIRSRQITNKTNPYRLVGG